MERGRTISMVRGGRCDADARKSERERRGDSRQAGILYQGHIRANR